MSQTAAHEDEDPWGTAAQASARSPQAGSADFEEPGLTDDITDDVVDASATEVPRKKSVAPKIVMGLMAMAVVGVAASGMWNLYRKIVPASEQVAEVDHSEAVEVALPAAGAGAGAGVLPGLPSQDGAASTIGAAPTGSPGSVATEVMPAAAPPPPAAPAPDAAPVPAPAPAVSAAATPAAAGEQVDPAATRAAIPSKSAEAAVPARTATPVATPLVATPRGTAAASERSKPARPPIFTARAASSARAPRQAPQRQVPMRPAAQVLTEVGAGVLTSYRIESIEPPFGEHQNAWIRLQDGRLQVVATGDAFEGGRVLKVDGSAYEVKTTQGVIR